MGQGGQPDMGAMLQMLQNPGVQQAVQGIMAQPQLMQAMMAANPQMQAMMNQNPQMRCPPLVHTSEGYECLFCKAAILLRWIFEMYSPTLP